MKWTFCKREDDQDIEENKRRGEERAGKQLGCIVYTKQFPTMKVIMSHCRHVLVNIVKGMEINDWKQKTQQHR